MPKQVWKTQRKNNMYDYMTPSSIAAVAAMVSSATQTTTMKSEKYREKHGDADGIEVHSRQIKFGRTPKPDVAMAYQNFTFNGEANSVAGKVGVGEGPTMLDYAQFTNVFGNETLDQRFYLSSMTQEILLTNFTNTPIVLNWYYYMPKETLDAGDVNSSPYKAMIRDIGIQDNAGQALPDADAQLLNTWGQSLKTGYNLSRNHRLICKYELVMGPYATRKLRTFVDYSQYVNRQDLANIQGSGGRIKNLTLETVIQIHGVVGKTESNAVTLASASLGYIVANKTYYATVESSTAQRFQSGALNTDVVTRVGNVDSGIISTVNKV